MLHFSAHPSRPWLSLLVDRDDETREYAYREGSAEKRGARLREGLRATGRIIVLGLVAAYQILALRTFYPGEGT